MYPITKDKFINPSQIAHIEVEEKTIVDKKGEKSMTVVIAMSNGKTYEFTKPKIESVKVVNTLISMINIANNPLLSLPAQQQQEPPPPVKRIPSDGKGPGSHKVDQNYYPKDKLGPDGYPIKDEFGNTIKEENPAAVAKQAYDAQLKKDIDEGKVPSAGAPTPLTAPVQPIAVQEMPVKEIPKEKTGQMEPPTELQQVGEPSEDDIKISSAFDGANNPTKENPFG